MGKGLRKAIPSTASPWSVRKLQILSICEKKAVGSIGGNYYAVITLDDFTRYFWIHLPNNSDTSRKLEQHLCDVKNHGKEEAVHSDNGEFIGQSFVDVCSCHNVRRKRTTPGSPQHNGVANRALATIQNTPCSARIHASPRLITPAFYEIGNFG